MRSLNGSERFEGIDATVTDLWRFALGDLKMNNARGYLPCSGHSRSTRDDDSIHGGDELLRFELPIHTLSRLL
jgi:hypothetical protein